MIENKDNIVIYAVYSMLFVNDMACNCIKDIEPFMKDKDKETVKIYGALKKRAIKYLRQMGDICGEGMSFVAEYCSYIDEFNEENLSNLRNAIKNEYDKAGVKDSDYLAHVEIARSMVEYSISLIDSLCKKMNEQKIDSRGLGWYRLTDVGRVMKNFTTWAYRHIDVEVNFNSNKELVSFFDRLNKEICSYKTFTEAYEYAIKECADE